MPTLLLGHMRRLVSAFARGPCHGSTAPLMLWDRRLSYCSHLWTSLVSGRSLQKPPTRRQRAHSRHRTHDTTIVIVPILGIHTHRDGESLPKLPCRPGDLPCYSRPWRCRVVVTSDTSPNILEPLILAGDVRHLFSGPVFGRTFGIPLALMLEVTSICGAPRGAVDTPSRWNLSRRLLS